MSRLFVPLLALLLWAVPVRAEEPGEIVFEPFDEEEAPESPEDETSELQWVVVQRRDGSTVSGTLIRSTDDGLEVASGDRVLLIPNDDIVRVVSGGFDDPPPAAVDPPTAPAPPEPPRLGPAANAGRYELAGSPALDDYRSLRLQLIDGRGRRIGPEEIGYRPDDFGRRDRKRFHVIFGGDPGEHVTIPEFARLADLPALTEELERRRKAAQARTAGGLVLLGVGQALLTGAIISGAVFQQEQDVSALSGMPIFVSGSITTFVIGAFVTGSGLKWTKRYEQARLDRVWLRSEAWEGVDAHNARLREDLGLPDDETLDGPED